MARLLPQALQALTAVLLFTALAALSHASADRLVVEAPLYAVLVIAPPLLLFLYRKQVLGGLTCSLLADGVVTAVLLLRLLLGHASLSGTALFVCVKILSAALFLPWGSRLQLIVSMVTTLAYWLVMSVHGEPVEARGWMHQVLSPLIATLLSFAGAVIVERLRAEHDEAEAQLSSALEQARRAENEKTNLLEIARKISGTVDLNEVVERLQRDTAALLDCDSVATFISDRGGESFHLIGVHGPVPELRDEALATTFPRQTFAMHELDSGRSLIAGAPAQQQFVAPDILSHFQVKQIIISPLRVADRFFGGLVAVRTQSEAPFEPRQVSLLEGIAGQLALVLEVIELYRKAQEEAEASGSLAYIARQLVESPDSATLVVRLCEAARSALDCDVVVMNARNAETKQFLGIAASGLDLSDWDTVRALPLPQELIEREVARAADPDAWQSAVSEDSESILEAFAATFSITQLLRLPLRREGEIDGLLTVSYRGRREPFSSRQVQTAKSICQLAALVWQNRQLIEQLEQANRLQSDFVATMSHELRTPLNIITGYTDLLLEDTFGAMNPEQRTTLQRVERSAQELIELVNTTLQVSRLDTGRVPIEMRSFPIADLVDETAVETRELWDRPGLTLTWRVTKAVPPLISDRAKLKVILKNLIGNAAKFTEAGSIRVEVDAAADGVAIEVIDSGVGIPEEALPIIFQRFRQADTSMTRRFDGVGLGLYIVSRLLEMLGGTIRVESKVGHGSKFSVWLPAQPSQKASPRSAMAVA